MTREELWEHFNGGSLPSPHRSCGHHSPCFCDAAIGREVREEMSSEDQDRDNIKDLIARLT